MADHAIVIGIDSHTNAAWRLTAAVRDALAFAHWVTEKDAGRATPETLTLLLSPNAEATIQTELAYRPATREHIENTLYAYSSAKPKAGVGSGRLWFFYAGHGVAPQGGGVDEAPVLVPANVADLHKYLALQPLEMSKFLRLMQIAPPAEQIYFIDACRGIVEAEDVVTSTQHLHFDLKKLRDVAAAQARQAVLYATTSGQLANEYKAHGLFGAALLEGLRGRGTSLEPDPATLGFLLTFDALASFTKRVIAEKS
jgi:uncharacterized caspase-like protein